MYLVKDIAKPASKQKPANTSVEDASSDSQSGVMEGQIESAISLVSNIIETACERSPDLDLMRLVNFMDLYRAYLKLAKNPSSEMNAHLKQISGPSDAVLVQKLGETELVSFERFVRDSRLISVAANAVSIEMGEQISAPPPLTLSANS